MRLSIASLVCYLGSVARVLAQTAREVTTLADTTGTGPNTLSGPHGLQISPDGSTLYVAQESG